MDHSAAVRAQRTAAAPASHGNPTGQREGLGRWLPAMPSIVKSDSFWLDPKDPHRPPYVKEGLLGPTIASFYAFNPGIAVANAQQVWGQMQADVIRNGVTPPDAAAKGFKQIDTIMKNYKIVES